MRGIPGEAMGLSFNPSHNTSDPVEAAWRDSLADGLERVLESGADSIEALADGLNRLSAGGRQGERWTPETLQAELRRLAF
jgi:hypothetical protein